MVITFQNDQAFVLLENFSNLFNLLQTKKMKKYATLLLALVGFFLVGNLAAQKASHDQMIITDSENARVEFIKKDKFWTKKIMLYKYSTQK